MIVFYFWLFDMLDEREVRENIVKIFFDFWFIIFKIEGIIFIFDLRWVILSVFILGIFIYFIL